MIYEIKSGKLNFIGNVEDFMTWCRENYQYEENRPYPLLQALGKSMYKKKLESTKHTFCYFDISKGSDPIGQVIFELFDEICPKTCENFKRLCEGVEREEKNIPIHEHPHPSGGPWGMDPGRRHFWR